MKLDVRGWIVGGLLLLLAAAPAPSQSRYLFTWAMETKETAYADPMSREPQGMGRDFLAVFDIAPDSSDFGRLVAMLPVGSGAQMAHHTNYEMPIDGILFASDYKSGNSFVFNLSDPLHPRLTSTFSNAGTYTHAHSFVRLANGNTLATFQYNGPREREAVGALVELDPNGKVVRSSDASDPSVEAFIRPYSLQVVAKLDRVVTGSDEMPPATGNSHVIQVWRLSDLKLLKSIVLPKAPHSDVVPQNAAEPRVLADGQTVVVASSACGLYRINDLGGSNPSAQWIYDFGARTCGVPTVVGNYWVEAITSAHAVMSLDMRDSANPVEAGRIAFKGIAFPHWISHEPGGNRIAITGYGWLSTHIFLATIDPNTGALALDARNIDFDRKWPDGWSGTAMPHGTVFSN